MSLEKEFVPYELALTLKELGFDEECLMCYRRTTIYSNGGLGGWEENWSFSKNSDYQNYVVDSKDFGHWVSAPLYQQAFRWFRKNHNLDSFCRQVILSGKSYWKINKLETDGSIKGYSNFTDSYEEAEFECLRRLIKMVKDELD